MKKTILKTACGAIALAFCLQIAPVQAQAARFFDVPTAHWAVTGIARAADAGVMTGVGNGKFAPSQTLTKAELAVILARAFYGEELNDALAANTDTWYSAAEDVLSEHCIFSNTLNGTSDMNDCVTRYDMAGMMCGVLRDKGVSLPSDAEIETVKASIPDWGGMTTQYGNSYLENCKNSASICYALGLLNGTDAKGSFSGNACVDRASAALIYARLAEKFGCGPYTPPAPQAPDNSGSAAQKPSDSGAGTQKPSDPTTQKPSGSDTQQPSGSDSTTQKPSVSDTTSADAFSVEVVRLVNIERAKEGLAPLTLDPALQAAAQVRAKEIISVFSHTRPNGTSCFTILKERGIGYRTCGENIAAGQTTPAQVVEGWMNSPGHRANIMNASYGKIGVGYIYDTSGGYRHYWTQLFTN